MHSVPPLPSPWPHTRDHIKWSHPLVSWDKGKSLNDIMVSGVDGENLRVRVHSWMILQAGVDRRCALRGKGWSVKRNGEEGERRRRRCE